MKMVAVKIALGEKQAVESILKAPAAAPHPLPQHDVGGVGMFFIRRGGYLPPPPPMSVSQPVRE